MKVLVTGGAGFIGSNLIQKLVAAGHDVHSLDNYSTGHNTSDGAVYYYGDVRDLQSFGDTWIKDYELIYHLAALARIQPSFTDPQTAISVNSQGTLCTLEFARKCKARVVYAGSSSFYHDVYANPYTFSKWQGEELCTLYNKVYGLSTVTARFFNVYGPRQICEGAYATVIGIFEKQKKEGKPLTVTGTGEQRRDFTHVDDIVSGLMLLGEQPHNGDVYNLGSGTNYSINEVARMFDSEIEYLPVRPGEAWTTLADISEMQAMGWKPTVNLPAYVSEKLPTVSCTQH